MADVQVDVGRAFVVSDLHIQSTDQPRAQRFLRFLDERVAADPDCTLVIAGDLFDFWYATAAGPPPPIAPIVDALEALPRVVWLEGNHDLRLRRGLRRGSSIETHATGVGLQSRAGPRFWVEHGDRITRPGRVIRRLLTSPLAELGARTLGNRGTFELGNFVGRRRNPEDGYAGQSAAWLQVALAHAKERRRAGYDCTLLGHGHWLGAWPDRSLVCLGDWLQYFSYLEIPETGTSSLLRYEPQASEDPPAPSSPLPPK